MKNKITIEDIKKLRDECLIEGFEENSKFKLGEIVFNKRNQELGFVVSRYYNSYDSITYSTIPSYTVMVVREEDGDNRLGCRYVKENQLESREKGLDIDLESIKIHKDFANHFCFMDCTGCLLKVKGICKGH